MVVRKLDEVDTSKGIAPSTWKPLKDSGYRFVRKDKEVLVEEKVPSNAYKVIE